MVELIRNIPPFESYENPVSSEVLKALKKSIAKASEVFLGTQSNFDNLSKGKVRVIVASITPMERAFLVMNQDTASLFTDIAKDIITSKHPLLPDTISAKVVEALTGFMADDVDFVKKHLRNFLEKGC